MRLSFWQFAVVVAIAAIVWYLVFFWGAGQDGQRWIKSMNGFFFSSPDEDTEKVIQKKQKSGGEGWI